MTEKISNFKFLISKQFGKFKILVFKFAEKKIEKLRKFDIKKITENCKSKIENLGMWLVNLKGHREWWRETRDKLRDFIWPPTGSLSWKRVATISYKNLMNGRSRVMVTVGGVAVGIGAIVLLVSFGYGLQEIVTNRIIWPQALQIAEVTSETTSVKIDGETIAKVSAVAGVDKVAPAVRLASQITYGGSKMDVVVVAASNEYLGMTDLKILTGGKFAANADKKFLGDSDINNLLKQDMGEVAGVSTESATIVAGDLVDGGEIAFRLRDEAYTPVYEIPKKTAKIVGYTRGSIIESYKGWLVWGGIYEDVGGRGRVVTDEGKLMGKWMKATLPLWEDLGNGVYREMVADNSGQKEIEGFVSLVDISVLSKVEKQVEDLLADGGSVLGDSTASAELSSSLVGGKVSTATAKLVEVLTNNRQQEAAAAENADVKLSVWKDNEKEILVSDGLVRAWNKRVEEVLGSRVDVEYLVTSSILPKISGRVLSDKVSYKIVGVFADNSKPMVYVPLGDVESMGIKTYSLLKVKSKTDELLPQVRSLIQSMGLVTRSVADTLSQIIRLFTIIRFLLGSFGAIALMVALFGMFNTLTVSLLERTREIGVMKSLGTTNKDVTRIFLTEAVMISMIGGIMGVGLGSLLGRLLDRLLFSGGNLGQSLFVMPMGFGAGILVIALVVGVVTGWYPAKRASRISALNALRYE